MRLDSPLPPGVGRGVGGEGSFAALGIKHYTPSSCPSDSRRHWARHCSQTTYASVVVSEDASTAQHAGHLPIPRNAALCRRHVICQAASVEQQAIANAPYSITDGGLIVPITEKNMKAANRAEKRRLTDPRAKASSRRADRHCRCLAASRVGRRRRKRMTSFHCRDIAPRASSFSWIILALRPFVRPEDSRPLAFPATCQLEQERLRRRLPHCSLSNGESSCPEQSVQSVGVAPWRLTAQQETSFFVR